MHRIGERARSREGSPNRAPGTHPAADIDERDEVGGNRVGCGVRDAAHDGNWGMMAALHSTKVELIPLADAVAEVRRVPVEEYHGFDVLFG